MSITLLGALEMLSKGIDIIKDFKDGKFKVRIRVPFAQVSDKAILAKVQITNKSKTPASITAMKIIADDVELKQKAVRNIEIQDSEGKKLVVWELTQAHEFDRGDLDNLKILGPDTYLLENQAATGLVLFENKKITNVMSLKLSLECNLDKTLEHKII